MSLPEVTDVQRLRLEPGDALVVRLGEGQYRQHDAATAKERVLSVLGDHVPVLVIPHDASLGIVSAQALAATSAGVPAACEGRAPAGAPVPGSPVNPAREVG